MASDPSKIVRDFISTVWNAGDTSMVRSFIHPRYEVGGREGKTVGTEWVIANVTTFRHAFPDLTIEIEEMVASRDLVAVRTRLRGTHLGTWKEIAATGRQVDYQEAAFWTIDVGTGLIRRGSFIADGLTLRIQLGLLPASVW